MREWGLLEKVYQANALLPGRVLLGPGDDMAMVEVGGARVLIAVDQVADGVHFDLGTTPLGKIARKVVTRNLSDVAAMAAKPVAAVVAACLPKSFGQSRAQELFEGIRSVCAAHDCPLIGGDTGAWEERLILSVTVLAEPGGVEPIRRSGAQVGDAVCITGGLGGSLETIRGYTHHLDFEPRIGVARALATWEGLTIRSMIDVSDGLASDLGQICRASGVCAELWEDSLPISEAGLWASQRDEQPAWRHAIGDGEDYELCFTVPEAQVRSALPSVVEGVPVRQIGRIVGLIPGGCRVRLRLTDGWWIGVDRMGWEHGV